MSPERCRFAAVRRAAGQVVFKDDGYFLGHVFTFPPSRVLHRTVASVL
jgi:hypothetical protein